MSDSTNKNNTALITGAARGIGQAVAIALSEKGFNIVIADILFSADETIQHCKNNGVDTLFIKTDIIDRDERKNLIYRIRERFNRLDLLVNNAGILVKERKNILSATEESYDRVTEVNLKGPFFLTQAVAGWMIRQTNDDSGQNRKIINIASLTSYASAVSMAEYYLSKIRIRK